MEEPRNYVFAGTHPPNCRSVRNDLQCQVAELQEHKDRVCNCINETIDHLLDEELYVYPAKYGESFSFFSWLKGMYYLTLARYTNPLAYRMAWRVIDKLKQQTLTEEAENHAS